MAGAARGVDDPPCWLHFSHFVRVGKPVYITETRFSSVNKFREGWIACGKVPEKVIAINFHNFENPAAHAKCLESFTLYLLSLASPICRN